MSHVLAISGMHVSYVILGVQFVLDKLINRRKLKNYITIAILGFFMIITGGAASCMRACIMSGMLLISQNFYRKNNFYVTILFTFFILLFLNPYNIFAVRYVAFIWWNIGNCIVSQVFEKIYRMQIQN